jgi:hypothetical protein
VNRVDVVVETHASAERVLDVPTAMSPDVRERWMVDAVERAMPLAAHWGEGAEQLVPSLVAQALDAVQPEDALVLQLWPAASPVTGIVRFSIHASPGLQAVRDDLVGHPESAVTLLGEGRMGVAREWFHAEPFEDASIVGWQAVFADERWMVVLTLEPTLPFLLPALIDDVRVLALDTAIAIDGAPWRGADLGDPGLAHGGEEWSTPAPGPTS